MNHWLTDNLKSRDASASKNLDQFFTVPFLSVLAESGSLPARDGSFRSNLATGHLETTNQSTNQTKLVGWTNQLRICYYLQYFETVSRCKSTLCQTNLVCCCYHSYSVDYISLYESHLVCCCCYYHAINPPVLYGMCGKTPAKKRLRENIVKRKNMAAACSSKLPLTSYQHTCGNLVAAWKLFRFFLNSTFQFNLLKWLSWTEGWI